MDRAGLCYRVATRAGSERACPACLRAGRCCNPSHTIFRLEIDRIAYPTTFAACCSNNRESSQDEVGHDAAGPEFVLLKEEFEQAAEHTRIFLKKLFKPYL